MQISAQQLVNATGCRQDVAERWATVISAAMDKFGINTPKRMAAFIAQIAHESNLFTSTIENLNYSAAGLMQIFPSKFKPSEAEAYARRPAAIANRVYANRFGNGKETSGDGWRYRGRGPIQITFKDNYRACGDALGIDLVGNPDLLVVPRNGAMSAGWYWNSRNCNEMADAGDFDGVSDLINRGRKTEAIGDATGYASRLALYKRAIAALS